MKEKSFAQRWGEVVTSRPKLFIVLSLLFALGLGFGGQHITMSNDYRYFFGKENPQRLAFEKLQNVYSKDDSVLFVITPNDKKVFKKNTLEAVIFLTEKSWKLPFSSRVDSITNFQYSYAEGDDLIVKDLVKIEELGADLNRSKLEKYKTVALAEPLIQKRLINEDATVTAVNVRMNFPGKSPFEVPETVKEVRKLAQEFKQKFPNHTVHLTGLTMLNNAFNEAGMKDMTTLTPLMYLVILVIMFLLLRSISGVIATFGVIFLSIIGGMGFAGWAGIPLTPPSSIAPIVIMTLAIADSIHILKSILGLLPTSASKKEAIIEGLRVNMKPVFLTSFTTLVGFLSLNFSDTPPFNDLGNITAVGVTIAFLMSVVFLPAMVTILPLKAKVLKVTKSSWADKLGVFITKRRTPVFLITIFATVFLALQIPKIQLNDEFISYFDESIAFRTDSEYTMKNLTGIYQINYDLQSGESQGISNPAYLNHVEEFSNYMRTITGVRHVSNITDIFKRLNKNMHGDDLNYYKLPQNRELAAQYLLLYEMSLPYGLDLNNQIDVDKSSTRVVVTLGDQTTSQILGITERAEKWLQVNTPTHMHTLGTSPIIMFSHISERNVISMFWGTLLAFGLITIIMIFALGSLKYGLISLLPNIIPTILAFGVWSLAVGEAGFSIAIVASVTLGIVVDDTVHFLTKYTMAKKEKGLDSTEAIKYALNNVGSALVVTSIILVIGFGVLMFSTFKMNFILGALSALTIALALLVDFTLLPAILSFADKKPLKSGGVMKLKNVLTGVTMIILGFGASQMVEAGERAPSSENKGLWVAQQIEKRENGYLNQVSEVTMILQNKQGQESKRSMKIKTLEVKGDGDKSLTIFKSPRDVKGTSFLSFTHSLTPDDQWLYLPALKRVKRISSNNKSGPFMGSEFAYEDLSSQEVDKYTYKYLREENVLGVKGHVVEKYPVDKNSGYTKQIAWIDGTEWRIAKTEFYDRKAALLKTLTFEGYKKYPNNKWRADKFKMINHQTQKKTTLLWSNIEFGKDISSRDFDKNALKRIR